MTGVACKTHKDGERKMEILYIKLDLKIIVKDGNLFMLTACYLLLGGTIMTSNLLYPLCLLSVLTTFQN